MRFTEFLGMVLGLSLFSSGVAVGQEGVGQEAGDKAGRKAWLMAVALPPELENPVKVLTGKELTEVTLSKRSVGSPVKIPQDGLIRVVREVADPDNAGEVIYLTLAEARVPAGMTEALVIFVPVPENEAGLVFRARVQDLAKFRGGETLYMNLSPRKIAVRLGEDEIPLRSGEVKVHQVPRLAKSVNKAVSYHHFDPDQEKWKLLSASTVVQRPTRREICIFSWDPRFERVSYHGVTFPVVN